MIDKTRAQENNNNNNFTREFFSWEHAFDPDYNNNKNCINDVFNFHAKTCSYRSRTTNAPILSKIEIVSNLLKLEDFFILNTLGRGSFGVVHEAMILNKKIALKILHRSSDYNHKQQVFKSYLAEQNIKNLRHKNLITFLGCNNVDNEHDMAFIIYEFGGKFNLNQVILDGKIEITQARRKSFSLDLVNALEFIHSNNIVHMDLKPANIIVTDTLVCKLSDFGCSVKLDTPCFSDNHNNNTSNSINLNYTTTATTTNIDDKHLKPPMNTIVNSRWTAGTWFYRAPELFRNDSCQLASNLHVTTSCDIFSLGICMWQLLTRDSPYRGENPHVIIYQIVSKGLRPEYPDLKLIDDLKQNTSSVFNNQNSQNKNDFEQLYRLIVEKSWDSDPTRRFTAKNIKELLTNNFVCN